MRYLSGACGPCDSSDRSLKDSMHEEELKAWLGGRLGSKLENAGTSVGTFGRMHAGDQHAFAFSLTVFCLRSQAQTRHCKALWHRQHWSESHSRYDGLGSSRHWKHCLPSRTQAAPVVQRACTSLLYHRVVLAHASHRYASKLPFDTFAS